ncbi:unnamed protein product [Orchesella dallaii]|uniref:Gustatory receptor n=1 Tax=Orchesella dallaii TaxID=48710 RepID=A0ABP1S646_9HEXA
MSFDPPEEVQTTPKEVQVEMESSEKNEQFHLFHWFFTTSYYLCLVPFRPFKNEKTKTYELHTNTLQKVLCYCSWMLIMLSQLTAIRYRWQFGMSRRHPVIGYFKLFHAHVHACMYLSLFRILHVKSSEIIEMLNKISTSTFLKTSGKTWWIASCTHLLWVMLGFIAPVIGYELIDIRKWDFELLLRSYATMGRFSLFVENDQPIFGKQDGMAPLHNDDVIYAFLQFVISVPYSFQLFTVVPLLSCCSITIWSATSTFVGETLGLTSKIKSCVEGVEIETISKQFRELKRLVNSINSVWNIFCFWYLIDIVAWYSTELDAGLVSSDYFVKFVIISYLASYTTLLVLSAESFRKMGHFCQWLSGLNDEENGYKNIGGLEREASSAVIGIGSKGFFQFDYSSLAQVTVVIITYFIISVDKSIERLAHEI